MLRRMIFALLLAFATTCALMQESVAQESYAPGGYGPEVLPLDRVLPAVRNGRAGRFFDAEGPFPDANGGYHYRIKWLTPQGRVIWLDADARSGRVLGVARGDWREQGPPPVGFDGPGARFRPMPNVAPRAERGPRGGWRDGPSHGRGR